MTSNSGLGGRALIVPVPYLWLAFFFPHSVSDRSQDQPVGRRARATALRAGSGLRPRDRRAFASSCAALDFENYAFVSQRSRSICNPICRALRSPALSTFYLDDRRAIRSPMRWHAHRSRGDRSCSCWSSCRSGLRFSSAFTRGWEFSRAKASLNQALVALGLAQRAARHAGDQLRRRARYRLFVSAVHGAAALCCARSTRRSHCLRPPPISARHRGKASGS